MKAEAVTEAFQVCVHRGCCRIFVMSALDLNCSAVVSLTIFLGVSHRSQKMQAKINKCAKKKKIKEVYLQKNRQSNKALLERHLQFAQQIISCHD